MSRPGLLSTLFICFLLSNCGGLRTFVFTAVAPGSSEVRLVYRRPWEPKAQAGESFAVRIRVQTKAPS